MTRNQGKKGQTRGRQGKIRMCVLEHIFYYITAYYKGCVSVYMIVTENYRCVCVCDSDLLGTVIRNRGWVSPDLSFILLICFKNKAKWVLMYLCLAVVGKNAPPWLRLLNRCRKEKRAM